MFRSSRFATSHRALAARKPALAGERLENRSMLAGDDHGHSADVHVHIEDNAIVTEHTAFGWDFEDEGGRFVADIGFDADDQPEGTSLRLVPKTNLLFWNGLGSTPTFSIVSGSTQLQLEGYAGSRMDVSRGSALGGFVTIGAEDQGVVHEHVAASIGSAPRGVYAFYASVESSASDPLAATKPIAFVLNRGASERVHDRAIESLEDRPIIVSASCTTPNGTYKAGQTIDVAVTFSDDIIIRGKPQIILDVGGKGRLATYHSHDAETRTSTFRYTIARQDPVDADGIGIGRTLRFAPGSSIRAVDGGAAVLSVLPQIDGSGVRIDTTVPRSTGIVSAVAAGNYTVGQVLEFRVNFSKPVVVTGSPRLEFVTNANVRFAGNPEYVSGSSSSQLTFRYTVQAGDVARNGVTLRRAFGLMGATVQDSLQNPAQFGVGRVTFGTIRVRPPAPA
jgi:hypothetical protein